MNTAGQSRNYDALVIYLKRYTNSLFIFVRLPTMESSNKDWFSMIYQAVFKILD